MDSIITSYAQLVMAGMKNIEEVPIGLQSYVEEKVTSLKKQMENEQIRQEEWDRKQEEARAQDSYIYNN